MEKYLKVELGPPLVKKSLVSCASMFKECELRSNYYDLEMTVGKWNLWDVDFWPELQKDSREMKSEIVQRNRKQIRDTLGPYIYTGNIIYTQRRPANEASTVFFKEHSKYRIILRLTEGQQSVSECITTDPELAKPMLQLLNSSTKYLLKEQGYAQLGKRNQLFFQDRNIITSRLMQERYIEQILGFGCPIHLCQGSILKMQIYDGSRTWRTQTMWEEYLFFKKEYGMTHDEIMDEYIIGRSFRKDYGNQETVTIHGEDPSGRTPLSAFPHLEKAKTFKEYYKKQYGLKIMDESQFLVFSTKRRVEFKDGEKVVLEEKHYFVPELLKPIGLTTAMRRDKKLMKEITQNGQMRPQERMEKAKSYIELINNAGKDDNPLGLKIIPNSNKVRAKLLPFPVILMKNKIDLQDLKSTNFVLKQPIYEKNARITDWIAISSKEDEELLYDMIHGLRKAGATLGIEVDQPLFIGKFGSKNPKTLVPDLMKCIESERDRVRIVFIMFPKKIADTLYKQVKFECTKRFGIPTQFFSNYAYNFTKNISNLSVAGKVVAQMAAKLGNRLWLVELPASLQEREKGLVVVGADVFHKNHHESLTSVVGTVDKELSRYYSQTGIQKRRGDDCLSDIKDKVINVAREYVKANNCPATTVVVFRDGVGESQLDRVREVEVGSLLKGLRTEFGDRVELLYIVVVKRVEAKFFSEAKQGGFDNPRNVVVDQDVIRRNDNGMYMISQEAQNGTVIPTYYEVLHDNSDLSKDEMYRLINCLCFTYPNWSGPLKIPAVVQMAHQQADVVGMFNCKEGAPVHEKLKNSLFFL
jgi:aubergine-like protein